MNKTLSIITLIISLAALSIALLLFQKPTPKVAYVRSYDLIYQYVGMKNAQNKFSEQKQLWDANIDTLKMDYQKSLSDYQKSLSDYQSSVQKLSIEDKRKKEDLLNVQYENLMRYSESIDKKIAEEDNRITQGILNQVNSFATEYAKRKGYDFIFGTTASGNILYGSDAFDVTDEMLKELNNSYNDTEEK